MKRYFVFQEILEKYHRNVKSVVWILDRWVVTGANIKNLFSGRDYPTHHPYPPPPFKRFLRKSKSLRLSRNSMYIRYISRAIHKIICIEVISMICNATILSILNRFLHNPDSLPIIMGSVRFFSLPPPSLEQTDFLNGS